MMITTFLIANVYCDMSTKGGGWIVIQRNRKNSRVSFDRNWREYKEGFGDLSEDFWAGLELMHTLTQRGQWEMRLDYQKEDKTWSYLHYNHFSVGSATEQYPLNLGGFTRVGSDWLLRHNKMNFTTIDNDNDGHSNNCAAIYNVGWWYHSGCYLVNINYQTPVIYSYRLFSEMKIRPKDCIAQ